MDRPNRSGFQNQARAEFPFPSVAPGAGSASAGWIWCRYVLNLYAPLPCAFRTRSWQLSASGPLLWEGQTGRVVRIGSRGDAVKAIRVYSVKTGQYQNLEPTGLGQPNLTGDFGRYSWCAHVGEVAMALGNSSARPEFRVVVLVVSSFEEDLLSLRDTLVPSTWTLYVASGAAEAKKILRQTWVPVILCERELPDGNWKDLLVAVAGLQNPPLMIVTSRLADEYLWAEVLNLGGYDVLAKPFNSIEVTRVMSMAWQRWKDECKRGSGGSAVGATC